MRAGIAVTGIKVGAIGLVGALVLVGCGQKPGGSGSGSSSSAASGKKFRACMVLDIGGVDDRSFNQSSYEGMKKAAASNPNITYKYVSSQSQNDYVPLLTKEAKAGCDSVIAVGGLMAGAVTKVAKQNPKVHFAEVDAPSSGDNVYGLQYNTAEAAFLAGYLAAGTSKSGKVATFGGLPIPPVTIYMDGFWEGVQYYNKKKGKKVQVLGWNEKKQKGGTFAQSFTDQGKGRSISQSFQQSGADVVFPVAGGTGLGAGAAAKASGGKMSVVWVDTDGCKSAAQYCKYFLTSATKNITDSVAEYLTKAAGGSFPTGNYAGDLKNDGVGIAPYHQYASKVPAKLKGEVDKVKADIISGKIKITSPSQPK